MRREAALIRLSDNLRLGAFKVPPTAAWIATGPIRLRLAVLPFLALKSSRRLSFRDLPKGRIGPEGHAPSLPSSLDSVEVEALPSQRVLLSRWSTVLWPPPTSQRASWPSLFCTRALIFIHHLLSGLLKRVVGCESGPTGRFRRRPQRDRREREGRSPASAGWVAHLARPFIEMNRRWMRFLGLTVEPEVSIL